MWRTKGYTPIFNNKNFINKLICNGAIDNTFHNRILETVLFPGSKIEIVKIYADSVEISTPDYPSDKSLYTLRTFLEEGEALPQKAMPTIEEILRRLRAFPKIPYLLGGSTPSPVYFDIPCDARPFENRNKKLFGIDCSGLIYYVTNKNTPRNTSDMFSFGKRVTSLKPLDLILFPGHVLVYLGENRVIESRQFDGVTISNWQKRKKEISEDLTFIRFHPQAF